MIRIIIGDESSDIIRYKINLKDDEWANHTPVYLTIRINGDALKDIKWFVGKFNNDFNFDLVKEDGIYSCNSELHDVSILSKFPNGDVICKMYISIWEQVKLSKRESRDIILDELFKSENTE